MTRRLRFIGCLGVVLSGLCVACEDAETDAADGGGEGGEAGSGAAGGGSATSDKDGDGHAAVDAGGDDCDDTAAATFPGAPDTAGDGIDQSCDGIDGVDADGDGYASSASQGDDCNDGAPSIHPGASDGGQLGQSVVFTADRPSQDPYLALTSDGAVHIGFTETYHVGNAVHHRPKLTSNASGSWVDQSFGEDGFAAGIASAGTAVHFTYYRTGNLGVVYGTAESTAPALAVTQVSPEGSVRGIALDPQGAPHLALRDGGYPLGTVSHAEAAGGSWDVAPVESQAESTPGAIAIDFTGAAGLLYATSAGLILAREDGAGWSTQTITPADVGDRAALAFDAEGGAHVLFESEGMVRYAGPDGAIETIPVDIPPSYAKLQLAVAPDGSLHMAVSKHYNGAHVYYGALGPDGWVVHKIIENTDTIGEDASLAIAADGTVHFAYTGAYSVYHATIAAANGVDDDCDGEIW